MGIDPNTLDPKEKAASIGRITRVVKGGRDFRLSALVVVRDESGHVGVGAGKFIEVPEVIRKGVEGVKKNLVEVSIVGITVPYEIHRKFSTGNVFIMPATESTGVMTGGPARSVFKLVGLKDVRAKLLDSNNPRNIVKVTTDGLVNLRIAEGIAKLGRKSVEEVIDWEG